MPVLAAGSSSNTAISSSGDISTIGGGADDDVIIVYGPDLNGARPKMDKKLYRHITLSNNGLQCVLICDTVALRRRRAMGATTVNGSGGGRYDDDDDDSEDDDEDEDDSDSKYSIGNDDHDDYDEDGLRKAATALLVNVGSYHDPPHLQGLAHFLEHMLFLGTELYPQENAYDAFLSKMGGDDNAYTGGYCFLSVCCCCNGFGDGYLSVALFHESVASRYYLSIRFFLTRCSFLAMKTMMSRRHGTYALSLLHTPRCHIRE